MRFDNYVKASFIGALSTVATELVSLILRWVGILDFDIYSYNSRWISMDRPEWPLGMIIHFIVGGTSAFLLYWFLEKVSSRNVIIKAIGVNLVGWLVLRLFSVAFIEGRISDIRSFDKYYWNMALSVVNGLVQGILLWRIVLREPKDD